MAGVWQEREVYPASETSLLGHNIRRKGNLIIVLEYYSIVPFYLYNSIVPFLCRKILKIGQNKLIFFNFVVVHDEAPRELIGHIFFLNFFPELQEVFFLIGQASPPPRLLAAGQLKKNFFAASLNNNNIQSLRMMNKLILPYFKDYF